MRLTLVRHGESTWNATGRWQGQSDVPLSPRGQLQARALAARLYERAFDARLCSDLERAAMTAAALGGEPCRPDPRWREIDVGAWAGLSRAETASRFAEQVDKLRLGQPVRIGGGESIAEFEARVDAALDELRARRAGEDVLVVSHGGVVRAIVQRALGVRGRISPMVGVSNTSLTVLSDEGGALSLETYNDALHLDAPAGEPATSLPGSVCRLALVAADPRRRAKPGERARADAVLSTLQIAQYLAVGEAAETPLAEHLLAEPTDALDLEALRDAHADAAIGVVVAPDALARAVSEALDAPGRLAPPPHGAFAQLRLFGPEARTGAEMLSYGVHPAR